MLENTENLKLNKDKICKATGWHNNCGLNCLTHLLKAKLDNNELEEIFSQPAYLRILESFKMFYKLDFTPSWSQIKTLLNNYANPIDHEAILSPVLRYYLGSFLFNQAPLLWENEGQGAFSEYIEKGAVMDVYIPIYNSNMTLMKTLRNQYLKELEFIEKDPFSEKEKEIANIALNRNNIPERLRTENKIKEQILFNRKNDLLEKIVNEGKESWLKGGCKNYALYIGELLNSVMVSGEHLQLLCQHLNIGLSLYGQNYELIYSPNQGTLWNFKVINSGLHWEYESIHDDVNEHNKFYSDQYFNEERYKPVFNIYLGEELIEPKIVRSVKIQLANEEFKQLKDKINKFIDKGIISQDEKESQFEQNFKEICQKYKIKFTNKILNHYYTKDENKQQEEKPKSGKISTDENLVKKPRGFKKVWIFISNIFRYIFIRKPNISNGSAQDNLTDNTIVEPQTDKPAISSKKRRQVVTFSNPEKSKDEESEKKEKSKKRKMTPSISKNPSGPKNK